MKRFLELIFLILSIHLVSPIPALNAQELSANLYDQGKFSEALEVLQKNGLNTAADFYNAGNCLFKLGKLGQAFAYYQKANALNPSNADITHNLNLTNKLLSQGSSAPAKHSFWVNSVIPASKRIGWLVYFFFGLSCVLFAFASSRATRGKDRIIDAVRSSMFVTSSVILLFFGAMAITITVAQKAVLGVIVSDIAIIRSGPSEKFTELTKLVAGSDLKLTDEKNSSWRQIELSKGALGWVEEKDLLEL